MQSLKIEFYRVEDDLRYADDVRVFVRWGARLAPAEQQMMESAFDSIPGVQAVGVDRYSGCVDVAAHLWSPEEFQRTAVIATRPLAKIYPLELHFTALPFGVPLL